MKLFKYSTKSGSSNSPIRSLLLTPLSIVIFLIIGGATVTLLLNQQNNRQQFSQHLMADAAKSLQLSLNRKALEVESLGTTLLHNSQLPTELLTQDRKQLLTDYEPLFQILQDKHSITHFYFHHANRTNLLRLHKPEKYGDHIDRYTIRKAEKTGEVAWGIELGPLGTFTLRVVRPVYLTGTLVGYLELGLEIEEILNLIHKRLNVELAVSIHKKALNQQQWEAGMKMLGREARYDRYATEVLVFQTLPSFPKECDIYIHGQEAHDHKKPFTEVQFNKRSWKMMFSSLQDVSGTEVGELIIWHDITGSKAAFVRIVIVATGLAMFLSVCLIVLFYKILTRVDQKIHTQQERLQEQANEWQETFHAIPDVILLLDRDKRIVRANQAASDLFQIKLDDLPGTISCTLFNGEAGQCPGCPVTVSLRDKKNHATVIKYPLLEKTFQLNVSPVLDCNNEVQNIVYTAKDITNIEKLESQLHQAQKMESVGRLAGGVAHDFNNILSAINGYSELCLAKMEENSPFQKEMQIINESGKRATRLTQQLLAFSRKQIIRQEVIDLNKEVSETQKMVGRLLGENIEIEIFLSDNLWKVKADRSQIEQVVLNLAINASDAMPTGGKLTIETANITLDPKYSESHYNIVLGDYVMLALSDTGCGMSREEQENIFEPFFTTKETGKGTGLGLATVHGIIKQNNGEINVCSELDKGSTFKIYLPRAKEPTEQAEPEQQTEKSIVKGTETVLLVEDEEVVRTMIVNILSGLGYTVLEAKNGEDAMQVCSRFHGRVDLLLTDVVMPKMTGVELAENMHLQCPEPKVLYMSGYTENAIVKHGVLADDVNFIHKPVSPKSLSLAVRKILD